MAKIKLTFILEAGMLFLLLLLLETSNGYPPHRLADIELPRSQSSEMIEGSLDFLIAIAGVLCLITVVFGCLCCRNFVFKNSHSNPIPEGYDNVIATTEFTIFPPGPCDSQSRGSLVNVKFEPLPDIRPRGRVTGNNQPRPANFSNVVNQGLSVQDWFEEPHNNFPRHQLKYLQEVGSGWFGQVVEGEAQGIGNIKKTKVVVKILREDATPTDQIYFLHEVKPFRDLSHTNVMKLLGKCVESDPFLLIFEYCAFKNLRTYLIQHRTEAQSLIQENLLLRMACNIAAGLHHMHTQGFVHTDLAARNCLVSGDLQVKIGDYGDSIERFRDNYYCAGDIAVPIRWCAPETLRCTDTTIETKEVNQSANIWSFGVVFWEVIEFGKLPYSELNDEDVLQKIIVDKSMRLPQPDTDCSHKNRIYQVMKLCWLDEPNLRPNMEKLQALLMHLYSYKDSSDFETRWNLLQPKVTRSSNIYSFTYPTCSAMSFENNFSEVTATDRERHSNYDWERDGAKQDLVPSFHSSLNLEGEFSATKQSAISPSLRNLRGSLDDLNKSCTISEQTSVSESDLNGSSLHSNSSLPYGKTRAASLELLQPITESCSRKVQKEFDAWLLSQQAKGAEASLMAEQISEALHHLDDAFANEKSMSSEENSHKSSPEREDPIVLVAVSKKLDECERETHMTLLTDSNISDDETWKEITTNGPTSNPVTELVREKSQSVQDFLKLTVIDSDNSSDSDIPSLERMTTFTLPNEASVKLQEFVSMVVGASLSLALTEVVEQQLEKYNQLEEMHNSSFPIQGLACAECKKLKLMPTDSTDTLPENHNSSAIGDFPSVASADTMITNSQSHSANQPVVEEQQAILTSNKTTFCTNEAGQFNRSSNNPSVDDYSLNFRFPLANTINSKSVALTTTDLKSKDVADPKCIKLFISTPTLSDRNFQLSQNASPIRKLNRSQSDSDILVSAVSKSAMAINEHNTSSISLKNPSFLHALSFDDYLSQAKYFPKNVAKNLTKSIDSTLCRTGYDNLADQMVSAIFINTEDNASTFSKNDSVEAAVEYINEEMESSVFGKQTTTDSFESQDKVNAFSDYPSLHMFKNKPATEEIYQNSYSTDNEQKDKYCSNASTVYQQVLPQINNTYCVSLSGAKYFQNIFENDSHILDTVVKENPEIPNAEKFKPENETFYFSAQNPFSQYESCSSFSEEQSQILLESSFQCLSLHSSNTVNKHSLGAFFNEQNSLSDSAPVCHGTSTETEGILTEQFHGICNLRSKSSLIANHLDDKHLDFLIGNEIELLFEGKHVDKYSQSNKMTNTKCSYDVDSENNLPSDQCYVTCMNKLNELYSNYKSDNVIDLRTRSSHNVLFDSTSQYLASKNNLLTYTDNSSVTSPEEKNYSIDELDDFRVESKISENTNDMGSDKSEEVSISTPEHSSKTSDSDLRDSSSVCSFERAITPFIQDAFTVNTVKPFAEHQELSVSPFALLKFPDGTIDGLNENPKASNHLTNFPENEFCSQIFDYELRVEESLGEEEEINDLTIFQQNGIIEKEFSDKTSSAKHFTGAWENPTESLVYLDEKKVRSDSESSTTSCLFELEDIDNALAKLENDMSGNTQSIQTKGELIFFEHSFPKNEITFKAEEKGLTDFRSGNDLAICNYVADDEHECKKIYEFSEIVANVAAFETNDAQSQNHFSLNQNVQFVADSSVNYLTEITKHEDSVVFEDLDSVRQNAEMLVMPTHSFDEDDEVLIIDTETNEAHILESTRPQSHLAFVRSNHCLDMDFTMNSENGTNAFKNVDNYFDEKDQHDSLELDDSTAHAVELKSTKTLKANHIKPKFDAFKSMDGIEMITRDWALKSPSSNDDSKHDWPFQENESFQNKGVDCPSSLIDEHGGFFIKPSFECKKDDQLKMNQEIRKKTLDEDSTVTLSSRLVCSHVEQFEKFEASCDKSSMQKSSFKDENNPVKAREEFHHKNNCTDISCDLKQASEIETFSSHSNQIESDQLVPKITVEFFPVGSPLESDEPLLVCQTICEASPEKCYNSDWESDSENSSQSASSTSGEFDCSKDRSLNIVANKLLNDQKAEEDLSCFTISSWDKDATPTKSSFRSPEKKKLMKKSVSFNTPKHQMIYEYPYEEKSWEVELTRRSMWDSSIYNPRLDVNSYTDWELGEEEIPEDIVEFEEFDDADNLKCSPMFHFRGHSLYKLSDIRDEEEEADIKSVSLDDDVVLYDTNGEGFSFQELLEHYNNHPLYQMHVNEENIWQTPVEPMSDFYYHNEESAFKIDPEAAYKFQFLPFSKEPDSFSNKMDTMNNVENMEENEYKTSRNMFDPLISPSIDDIESPDILDEQLENHSCLLSGTKKASIPLDENQHFSSIHKSSRKWNNFQVIADEEASCNEDVAKKLETVSATESIAENSSPNKGIPNLFSIIDSDLSNNNHEIENFDGVGQDAKRQCLSNGNSPSNTLKKKIPITEQVNESLIQEETNRELLI